MIVGIEIEIVTGIEIVIVIETGIEKKVQHQGQMVINPGAVDEIYYHSSS